MSNGRKWGVILGLKEGICKRKKKKNDGRANVQQNVANAKSVQHV